MWISDDELNKSVKATALFIDGTTTLSNVELHGVLKELELSRAVIGRVEPLRDAHKNGGYNTALFDGQFIALEAMKDIYDQARAEAEQNEGGKP